MDTNTVSAVHLGSDLRISTVPPGSPSPEANIGGLFKNTVPVSGVETEIWTPTLSLLYSYKLSRREPLQQSKGSRG